MKPLCQVRSPERRGADDVAQISRHAGAQAPARHGLLGMCMCACVCEWERGGGGGQHMETRRTYKRRWYMRA